MIFAKNNIQIEKCIVSFSHNKYDSRQSADKLSIAKAKSEIKAGKNGISHLILRSRSDEVDRLKFLFLIHGIPVMCYALGNLLCSSLKEIVVVGSDEVQRVMERFLNTVGTCGKKIQFVKEEDAHLNLVHTLNLGKNKLSLENNELVLFQPGDLPFLYDLEKVLSFKGNKENNIVLWLNSRQKMFPEFNEKPAAEFVKRNYHYRILNENDRDLHDLKEPNLYPINFERMDSDIIDALHSSRKDGQIVHAGIKMALNNPIRLIKALPYLLDHVFTFRRQIKKIRPEDKYQFGMSRKNFHKSISHLLNIPITTNLHGDPSFVSDVDALEDWEDFESLTHFASNQGEEGGLEKIHPFGDELLKFREEDMPFLKKEIPMYQNFPVYLNQIYQSLEMGYMPFDSQGNYVSPNANAPEVEHAYHWYQHKCKAMC
ncbi:MAG: nucleotidyltransferase family protein [Nitrospinae bacterium]|nr:nucleotidyltransferase family protein [Nitrospinota bacterium]